MKSLFRLVVILTLVVTIPLGWVWKRSGEPMTYPPAAAEVPGMSLRELVEDRVQAEKEFYAVYRPAHPYGGSDWAKPVLDRVSPAGIAAIGTLPFVIPVVFIEIYNRVRAENTPVAEIPDLVWETTEMVIWVAVVDAPEFNFIGEREWRRPIYDPAPVLAEAAQTQPGETVAHRECEFFLSAEAKDPRYMLLSTDPVEVLQESTAERIQVNVTIERVDFTGEGWIDRDCLIEE